MPALPEFRDILTQEWMAEVLLQMEAEDPRDADRHIRIAGEIEVHLQSVQHYAVPDPQGGLCGKIVPQELIDDAGEPVCQYDLFAQTNGDASESDTDIVRGHMALVQVCLHGLIPGNRAGNGNGEE